jgi:Ubiquitin carboxyl-terminal hydrolase
MGNAESSHLPATPTATTPSSSSAASTGWLEVPAAEAVSHRGLLNPSLAHHCFLNVVVQSLWHTHCFRHAILEGLPHSHKGGEVCLTCALRSLFTFYQHGDASVELSVDAVRASLVAIYGREGDERFNWSSMADASETLEAVLAVLHSESLEAMGMLTDSDRAKPLGELLDKSCEATIGEGKSSRKVSCPAHSCFSLNTLSWMVCPSCLIPSEPSVGSDLAYLVYISEASEAMHAFQDYAARQKANSVLRNHQQQQQQHHQASSNWQRLIPHPQHWSPTGMFGSHSSGGGTSSDGSSTGRLSPATAAAILSTPALIAADDPAFFRGVGEIPPCTALSPRDGSPDPALSLGALLSFMAGREAISATPPAASAASATPGGGVANPISPAMMRRHSSALLGLSRTRSDLAAAAAKRPHPIPSDPDEHGRRCMDRRACPERILLRLPEVFTLNLVWPTDTASKEEIAATMNLLSPQLLDLRQLFKIENDLEVSNSAGRRGSGKGGSGTTGGGSSGAQHASSVYRLRSMSMFYGRHWVSIVASDKYQAFLLIDDTKITPLIDPRTGTSTFDAVIAKVIASKFQPTIVIYEQIQQQHQKPQQQQHHAPAAAVAAARPGSASPTSPDLLLFSSNNNSTPAPAHASHAAAAGSAPPGVAVAAGGVGIYPQMPPTRGSAAATYDPHAYSRAIAANAASAASASAAAQVPVRLHHPTDHPPHAGAASAAASSPPGLIVTGHKAIDGSKHTPPKGAGTLSTSTALDIGPEVLLWANSSNPSARPGSSGGKSSDGTGGGRSSRAGSDASVGSTSDSKSRRGSGVVGVAAAGSGGVAAPTASSLAKRRTSFDGASAPAAATASSSASSSSVATSKSSSISATSPPYGFYPITVTLPLKACAAILQASDANDSVSFKQTLGIHLNSRKGGPKDTEEEGKEDKGPGGIFIDHVSYSHSTLAELNYNTSNGVRILPPGHPLRMIVTRKMAAEAGYLTPAEGDGDKLVSVNGKNVTTAEEADEALRDLMLNAVIGASSAPVVAADDGAAGAC